jgi:hypothetical protein
VFALIAMALSLGHWLGDLVAGYGHHVFGPDSHPIGTDWYHLNLPAALTFEAALGGPLRLCLHPREIVLAGRTGWRSTGCSVFCPSPSSSSDLNSE